MLIDNYNRIHNYLRISLTNQCNLRCTYCMPDEVQPSMPSAKLMQADEIVAITGIFVKRGVDKIRLTGGEPLMRKDASIIIEQLAAYPVELTMTTNGIFLHDFFPVLQQAGIRSLNISLDTLKPERFQQITKRDKFKTTQTNIFRALDLGFRVKINVVVMRGVNDDEVLDFIKWAKDFPVHIRFIEYMPFAGNYWSKEKVLTWKEILQTVSDEYDIVPLNRDKHDTAKKYKVVGHEGTFAVISTMTSPFCSDCNRMRLTADGKMKNCLFSQGETDLLSAFRNGEDIEPLIISSIKSKKAERGGQITGTHESTDVNTIVNRSMINIGG